VSKASLAKPYLPIAVSQVDLAFPANVSHLMPAYEDIPKEFKSLYNPWVKIFSDFFYSGAKNIQWNPKEGIDKLTAANHIRCIMGSFEPQHEHKEAACAYLMSLWFDSITYTKGSK